MGVDGVCSDVEVGGVADDYVENVGGVTVGAGNDLGAVGGVLVGHVGVGGAALVDEEPGQSPCGQRLGLIGSRSPSEDDRMPPPQILASWCWWWC